MKLKLDTVMKDEEAPLRQTENVSDPIRSTSFQALVSSVLRPQSVLVLAQKSLLGTGTVASNVKVMIINKFI